MNNNGNTTPAPPIEYTVRHAIAPIVQNWAADAGMTINEFCTMFEIAVAGCVAHGGTR